MFKNTKTALRKVRLLSAFMEEMDLSDLYATFNFMYLLDGAPVPDHSTIARFISLHLSQCAKEMMSEVGTILLDLGEISGENIFIDGTKIESVANKYTFVWKNTVSKNMIKPWC